MMTSLTLCSFQIQVVTMACSTWGLRPTCACALVFQAGRDIYLIDRCEGARFNGFLLQDDDILDVYETSDTRYQVMHSLYSSTKVKHNYMS